MSVLFSSLKNDQDATTSLVHNDEVILSHSESTTTTKAIYTKGDYKLLVTITGSLG